MSPCTGWWYILKLSRRKNSMKVSWADSYIKMWRFSDVSGSNFVPIFGVCWWFDSTKPRYFPKRRKAITSWRGCLPKKNSWKIFPVSIKLFLCLYATPNPSLCVVLNTYYIIFQFIIFRVCLSTLLICNNRTLLYSKEPHWTSHKWTTVQKKRRSNIQDENHKTIYHAPCRDPNNEWMITRRTVIAF